MDLNILNNIVNGKTNINLNRSFNKIKTDTRKIEEDDVFIALDGVNYNGEDFIDDAFKMGAITCITNNKFNNCIQVNNTYESLFDIALYKRRRYNKPLIAITGSVGKTTTKDLIVHILSSKYKVLYNKKNYNNIIGVSNTLFKLDDTYDVIVLELGSNHLGEIKRLKNMCLPDISVITNIGTSHIGNFKSKRKIFKEKLSIKNKELIVNGDDKYLKKTKSFKCGLNKNNNLKCSVIEDSIDRVVFNVCLDKVYKITFNNPGIHFINDILLAIKVCLMMDIDINTIINSVATYTLPEKRMNIIHKKGNIIINDCYNSSYESLRAGINYLNKINGNKILILGDILELGKKSKSIHKKINKLVKDYKNIYTVGKYSKYIKGMHFDNVYDLIEYFKKINIKKSYIYIKGSRKMKLDLVYDYFTK